MCLKTLVLFLLCTLRGSTEQHLWCGYNTKKHQVHVIYHQKYFPLFLFLFLLVNSITHAIITKDIWLCLVCLSWLEHQPVTKRLQVRSPVRHIRCFSLSPPFSLLLSLKIQWKMSLCEDFKKLKIFKYRELRRLFILTTYEEILSL